MSGSRAKLIRKAAHQIAMSRGLKYSEFKNLYRRMKKEWVRR
jgi:hypothetical protein